MRKQSLFILAAILIVLGASAFAAYQMWVPKPQSATVTIGYRTHDLYAPLFIGLEKGFFEKESLSVNTVKFESTNQLTDALLAGKIDAVLGGANMPLLLTIEGKSPGQLKIFSVVYENEQAPSSSVIVKPDSSIQSMKDLQGKKIGAFPGSTAQLIYRKMLAPSFDPSGATLVQMEAKLLAPALESGQIDAAIVLEPAATIAVSKGAARILEKSLFHTYIQKNIPVAASVFLRSFSESKPDVAKHLVLATDEAIRFINTYHAETREILPKHTYVDPGIAKNLPIPPYAPYMSIKADEIQSLANLLLQEHELKNAVRVEPMLYRDK